ncbi:hypothetical protein M407DRAFT_223237 [Tulasnella calospora MUT 4182]|uniref:Uncharacterized protein n=1 Tax=Tulasnella calospora MUT 4182 TaxID=1051891 RepID=A0A0C3PWA8_9AGAM|nr:hypothetical protein M407DRAFT_223237 [Tulasnella calospora MUT 4182]
MSLIVQPGLSVLIEDVTDLDPNINLLPGADIYYSAYPAADGKVGIYTKWSGEGGAEQAITGIRQGVAPRSTTWSKAVDLLKSRYCQLNPPGAGITSVLIVRDSDNDGGRNSPTATAGTTNGINTDAGAFGGVMELLNSLPTHVLEAACKRHPVGQVATSTLGRTATTMSASTRSQVFVGPVSEIRPPNNAGITTWTEPVKPTAQSSATTSAKAPELCTPMKQRLLSATPITNSYTNHSTSPRLPEPPRTTHVTTSPSVQTLAQVDNPAARAPVSTGRGCIDSPLRAVGAAYFTVPKECYVMGHWTRTVLEFMRCDKEVILIIEERLCSFAFEEDDVELQALFAEDLTVELHGVLPQNIRRRIRE